MWKQKYNWPEIKLEYMMSKDLEVKSFLERKFGENMVVGNWNFDTNTKGWRIEKINFINQTKNETLEEYRRENKNEYKSNLNLLSFILNWAIDLTSLALKYEVENCTKINEDWTITITRLPNMWMIEKAYKIAKTELSEVKVENKFNYELSDEEKQMIDRALGMNI